MTEFAHYSRFPSSLSWASFLSFLLWSSLSPIVAGNTKLVIFAGPHKAASTSVESFFYEYASGHSRYDGNGNKKDNEERKKTFGLRFWLWPQVSGKVADVTEPDEPYKIFGHLVTDAGNEVLEKEILEGIREAWETQGIEGVVIGSEMFDQIGEHTSYDAMKALRKVVTYLNVHPNDVTVALNYRTPRLEQWASMWSHDTNNEDYTAEYNEWMCDADLASKHIEVLATQMNPLNAAQAFVNEGWNVRLIDMEGVEAEGRDISHVVACDVVAARCEEGVVLNHQGNKPHKNVVETEFSALTQTQQEEAEQLFRSLDCSYELALRVNVKFGIVYNHSVWHDCDPKLSKAYTRLREEPSTMYAALLSQIKCPKGNPLGKKGMVDMHAAITGGSATRAKRSMGSIFMEFALFVFIVVGAMGYQYHRMTNTRELPAGAHRIETAATGPRFEEGQFNNDANVDAEYGDADEEFEDEIGSSYKD